MQIWYLSFFATLIALQTNGGLLGQSPQADTSVINAWKDNSEVRQCGLCHFSPGNDFATRETDFCRLIEAKLWLTNDKHAIARRRIEPLSDNKLSWSAASNRLSYAIVSRLGYAIDTEAGYAQFRDNCLTCHAGYQGHDDSHEFERTSINRPGITCGVCHQIGDNTSWVDEHGGLDAKKNWRTREPKLKAQKGMRSLVSVDAQADLCLACHVGDIKQNMFVTHQMYAAGHPPLPSMELSAMLDAMPRHWRTNAELYQSLAKYSDRTLYFQRNLGEALDNKPIDHLNWQAQTVVLGAVAAHQQSLTIIEQAASPNSQRWGDYALYDCAACHHELKVPSARQTARIGSVPGRPRLAEWPQALSEAAFASMEDSQVTKLQLALRQAVSETPFGNRKLVAQRASELNTLLSGYRTKLDNTALTTAFANRYLIAVSQTSESQLIDYHAARQINWALRSIDAELAELGTPLPDRARRLIAELGTESNVIQVGSDIPGTQSREIYPTFIDAELKRQSQYDSQQFHRKLKSVFDSLRRF